MNLTPANWKKSEVTENKQYVEIGMRLYTPGSNWVTVIERNDNEILVREDNDPTGEWDNWYNLDDLQIGWNFSNKDMQFIEAIKA